MTKVLGLPDGQLLPAYEDPLAAVADELRQPEGERPETEQVDHRALDAGVDAPTGWVLPIATGEEWTSPAWRFRRGRLVLTQGTSPVGLRLPLDAIAWKAPEYAGEPSYLETGPPLEPAVPVVTVADPEGAPTTALTFETRDGHVHVFLPPTERLEDYTDLLRLVEVAARKLQTSVVLEGYGPPPDGRITQLVVTPDPGVIEVNVQPTRSWAEQRDLTVNLYQEARQARLTTEKFDHDGLHTGTGGGNHLTLGGHQPVDSPLLRRPDLLVSLITYWQRHPSLSYLFSGRFIGPTSQAPRFDEGRPEATYEMEIAFAEIDRLTEDHEEPRPWLVDRALRHLLTDLTGNTHRAEFCIDKMYSPDSSRGRLGLLELRGFEMPPHAQMALVQALLVRSLVAMFWEKPLRQPLVRWGTRLHEDPLLPHGATGDINAVVADLRAFGIAFEEEWLAPFTEFRFPRIGVTRVGDVEVELRQAIEPWHVLGEETTGSGTSRYVDSSVERLQVSVRGLDPSRHLVTCQGVPVPLTETAAGDHYAGVRFRAWQPWSALHPSIEVQAPLRFDVVDIRSAVSLGGATYHVVHPGGRSYDAPPVNANEAEARRASRFEPHGHTAGRLDVGALREAGRRAATDEYPHTLDLRRVPPPSRTVTVLRDYAAGVTQPTLGGEPSRYDEVVGPDGSLRAAWKGMAELAVGLTAGDLQRVDDDIVRALADDGVTYSRPGDAREGGGAWRLDPVPLLIDAAQWTPLEVGLAQRAELLNAVLADLYGEQRLLSEGVLPAAAVLGHPGFLRVVARRSAVDPRPLVLSATDLGRDHRGEWRVLADRAQAPSGLGYAMANRRVLSRVLPELYREAGLHRMEPFVSALRSALLQSASGDLPDPRVVVLSPGSRSETAYDQAFLASALGFPLVQGSDLAVRDGWVQVRVFGRLERVDVILRRVDAAWSDPLELRGDSQLGVAGLVEAVRRGRVRVVNGLGAGVLENPALLPSMAAMCEFLLGEPLRLASVPTWWCGEPAGLEQVLDRIGELAVRTVDGAPAEADVAAIRAAPYRYVGQERLPLSQAPTWAHGQAAARPLTLRTFTLRYGSAYRPLVGGLASVLDGERPGSAVGSKDVWVLKADGATPDQGLADVLPMTVARATTGTVPRILEDMFWFGRYAERAEDLLRLVLADQALADDFRSRPRSTGAAGLEVMLGAVTRLAGPGPERPGRRLPLGAPRRVPRGLGRACARGAARLVVGRARPAVARRVAGLRSRRPGHAGPEVEPSQPPDRRVGRTDADRHPVAAGRHRQHDPRPGLAHDRAGPPPRAGAAGRPPARRHHDRPPRSRRRPRGAQRRPRRLRELGDPPPSLPRVGATRRRPRAAAHRRRQPALAGLRPGPDRRAPRRATGVHRVEPTRAAGRRPARRARRHRHRHPGRDRRRRPPQPRRLPRAVHGPAAASRRRGDRAAPHERSRSATPGRRPARRLARGGPMRYRVRHTTTYTYDAPVSDSLGVAHLVPQQLPWQQVTSYAVQVSPAPADVSDDVDYYGNLVTYFQVTQPHDTLVVEGVGEVEVVAPSVPEEALARPWESVRPLLAPDLPGAWAATDLALPSAQVDQAPGAAEYAAASLAPGRPVGEAVTDLMHRVHSEFDYDRTATTVTSTVADTLARRAGVCQDFAHLMLACLRSHGLAARYVSGYLATEPPPGKERVVGADASHAWVEVWLGRVEDQDAWLAVDPTNDQRVSDRYVTVARGRDYGDVPPLKGVIVTEAKRSTMRVAVDVAPLR